MSSYRCPPHIVSATLKKPQEGAVRIFSIASGLGATSHVSPQLLHFRFSESSLKAFTASFICVPRLPIHTALRTRLLKHHTYSVGESYWVVWRVGGKEEELAFIDIDVFKFAILHRLEQHAAFILVEELRRLVDMVVGSSIWTTHDHHSHGVVVNTVVVDGRLEEMRILLQPKTRQLSQSCSFNCILIPFWQIQRRR
ncbi:3-hydroxyanthranilate [Hortaea werneckii]|nr:3-hydroxyanthranilate [Hortaea werneckii]